MADVAADRVRETSNTTGLASYLLLGEVPNFRRFDQVMQAGDRCYFAAVDRAGLGWETGYGTRLPDGRLERTALVSSSDDGRPINWGAGVRDVFITFSPVQLGLGDLIARANRAGPLTGAELISALQNGVEVSIPLSDIAAYISTVIGAGSTPPAAEVGVPFGASLLENGDGELLEDGFFVLDEA